MSDIVVKPNKNKCIVSGHLVISLQVDVIGIDESIEDEAINEKALELVDEYMTIGDYTYKNYFSIGLLDQDATDVDYEDLRENGDVEDGHAVKVNAVFPVTVESLRCTGDTEEQVQCRIKELLDKYIGVFDYTYQNYISVGVIKSVDDVELDITTLSLESEKSKSLEL
ncbi:hypothetical protein AB6D11_06490 [Vibrio splendidus]